VEADISDATTGEEQMSYLDEEGNGSSGVPLRYKG
jgi:hypothetical protein